MVATQRYAWCGDTILDAAELMMKLEKDMELRLSAKLRTFYMQRPGLLSIDTNFRRMYEHAPGVSFRWAS